jgi:hypothetical protein
VAVGAMIAAVGVPASAATTRSGARDIAPSTRTAAGSPCRLGNGVRHVVNITFDNVHFFRDNPDVPSDLEQMPTRYRFLVSHGTVLSNMHTPLIAHTAEDSLAIYSGLYGDRHGQPVSNSYRTYRRDGTTESDASFTYWTSPVISAGQPSATDRAPSMVYSPTVPASDTPPTQIAPEPWVAFTKAGCSVGAFSTANMVLENAGDIPTVFGTPAPPPSPYANTMSAFIGEAIHCGLGDATCEQAQGAVSDPPPAANKPGSATYKALFGHKYVAPVLAANASAPAPYRVTDAAGNLVDLDDHEIADFRGNVGFPGFNPTASQSLAEIAAMQEAGVPVTYGYISDIHERKDWSSDCTTASATATGYALGPGDSCYVENARRYDQAFAKFLDRLTKDGITPRNTVFVIGAEENDHFAGANVGRAQQPSPVGCDGVTTPCRYDAGQVGEVQANLPGLLQTERHDTTPFVVEPQGAAVYVTNPAAKAVSPRPDDPAVRRLERDTAALTADNPHSGVKGETIVNYQAGATEQRILHLETADPQRTPTFTVFPKPDYYFDNAAPACAGSSTPQSACVTVNSRFAWNHGYYSPDIDITWSSFVGPGVRHRGVDGPRPAQSPAVEDPDGGGLVPAYSRVGTWVDETDVRPTMLHLAGVHDDYVMDGRVITQILKNGSLRRIQALGGCYKQLNASVGTFGTDTLVASTKALASGSGTDDSRYTRVDSALSALADARDALAQQIKNRLDAVEFHGARLDRRAVAAEVGACRRLLRDAAHLAATA